MEQQHLSYPGAQDGSASPTVIHVEPVPSEAASPEHLEKVVNRWTANVASFTSFLGRGVCSAAGRVRDEVQSFWAEAQSVRRRRQG